MPVRRLPPPFGPQYAGFVERLMYQSLAGNLRTGQMSTVLNGKIVSATDARRLVARARTYGWLPPYIPVTAMIEGAGQMNDIKSTQLVGQADGCYKGLDHMSA